MVFIIITSPAQILTSMATDFMVRRALFPNSLLAVCLLYSSCTAVDKETGLVSFNADSLLLYNRNGILYKNNAPFSGKIFQLDAVTKDTLLTAAYYKGKEQGEWKRFYANGQLAERRYFEDGVKVKTLTRWWQNGTLQLTCTFANGEYDGTLQEWNENGGLVQQMHYTNGREEGSQKMYYDNGKIRSNYIVKDGKRTGLLGTKNCVNVSDSVFKK
jgi:antitoxin component YwqK of YwqJK toxin-antitoxin module